MALKPLFNKCLIEIIDEYAGITRSNENEDVQKGILRKLQLMGDHLTTSTGYTIGDVKMYRGVLEAMLDKVVFWEQYGEAGNIIEKDGKRFALIPFYRLIAWEDETDE